MAAKFKAPFVLVEADRIVDHTWASVKRGSSTGFSLWRRFAGRQTRVGCGFRKSPARTKVADLPAHRRHGLTSAAPTCE